MAIDFEAMTPVAGTGMGKRATSRTSGPNPFLDKGWLMESYNTGKDYQFGPVSGDVEEYKTELKKDGEIVLDENGNAVYVTRSKYLGDLSTIVGMIRAASNKLNIGSIIQVVPAANERGKPIKGQWFVMYIGKERKASRKSRTA